MRRLVTALLLAAACSHRGAETTPTAVPGHRASAIETAHPGAEATPRAAAAKTRPAVVTPTPRATAATPVHASEAAATPSTPAIADAQPPSSSRELGEVVPLTPDERAIFLRRIADEAPEARQSVAGVDNEKHYIAGNEKRLDAFAATIADRGGGYVGVGSDQAYLFIGWAKPELAWLVDYDPLVVDMHTVYRALLRAAATPEAFLRLWEPGAKDEALAAITNEQGARKRHRAAYGRNRAWISKRLRAVAATMRTSETASWLTDEGQYDYVRRLVVAGRVRPLVADLNAEGAVQGIAAAARELAVPIRVLYLSNAEGYWSRYKGRFRRNVAALPFDDDAVVLRTLLIWHINGDYRYNVQSAANYLQWLAQPFVGTVYDIVHDRPEPTRHEINFFVTDGDPDDSPAARRAEERASR